MSSPEIDEIKNRLNIAEVVGEYIRLQKAGSNWKALCPFHNEKTPSFMVSEERGSWHCFGCGKGGDVFSFVMELEGIGFRDALEQLAAKAGVELKRFEKQGWEDQGEKDNKIKLFDILELATKWYEKNLWDGKGKEKILKYLHDRGINDESMRKFRLGYAPDGWRNILEFLTKRGYASDEIAKTGLLVEKNAESNTPDSQYSIQNKNCYDRFRDRIMFPIMDLTGRVVGYSARVAPGGDEKNAKYINTPQTLLYDKSKILYGLNFAKVDIRKKDEIVMVEGNMDVIAAHQSGFPNTVAVSGTALTDEQVKILKRYSENIKMGFDMDPAGQAAARRSIKTCLSQDLNVKIIQQESGKDAADSLRDNPETWRQAVESARGVMEYYFDETFGRYDAENPSEKKKIASELLNVIKDVSNPVEQSHWLKVLATRLGTEEKVLLEVLKKVKRKEKTEQQNTASDSERKAPGIEQKILGILLAFPGACRAEVAKIEVQDFQKGKERDIIETIKKQEENLDLAKLKAIFSDYETGKWLEEVAFEAEVRFGSPALYDGQGGDGKESLDPIGELRGLVRQLGNKKHKEKLSQLVRDIKVAEMSGDKAGAKVLMEEFQKLVGQYANGEKE